MSKEVEEFNKKMAEEIEQEKARKELQSKKFKIEQKRVDVQFQQALEAENDLKIANSLDFGQFSQEQVEQLKQENADYIAAAKEPLVFINRDCDQLIPFFRRNLILVGAISGQGKSTAAANIARSVLAQKDPVTKQKAKVLVITNEQNVNDFYNAIICQIKRWPYSNHSKITPEQQKTFDECYDLLTKDGWLTVIGDNHGGTSGLTTSIEGMTSIFENLVNEKIHYSAIIIDYYQNVQFSKLDPTLNEWGVQAKFAGLLDRMKNIYTAPIVLMAQINTKKEKDDSTPFQYRIQGRKVIYTKCTCAVELTAEPEHQRSQLFIRKSRFLEAQNQALFLGYDSGRYVRYDKEFIKKIEEKKAQRMHAQHETMLAAAKSDSVIKDILSEKS
jgi:hypothetical protein